MNNPVGCIDLGGAASVSAAFVSDTTNNDIRAASSNTKLADTNGDARPQMLIDSTFVYWADATGIKKVPRAGGATTTILAGTAVELRALDGSTIYFVDDGGSGVRRLRKVQTNGSSAVSIAGATGYTVPYQDLSVDADFIYYAMNGASNRYLNRLPKTATWGDPPTNLATSTTATFRFPQSNGTNLYFVQVESGSTKIRRRTSGGTFSDQKTGLNPVVGTRLGSVDLFWVEDNGATYTVKRAGLP